MWLFIVLIIVGVIIYNISKDKNDVTKRIVSNYGGMLQKYSELVAYLKQGGCRVDKVSSDSLILKSGSMVWSLDVVGENLEIRMNGFMPMLGKIYHKWSYTHNFSQTRIIQDIENYCSGQMEMMASSFEKMSTNR